MTRTPKYSFGSRRIAMRGTYGRYILWETIYRRGDSSLEPRGAALFVRVQGKEKVGAVIAFRDWRDADGDGKLSVIERSLGTIVSLAEVRGPFESAEMYRVMQWAIIQMSIVSRDADWALDRQKVFTEFGQGAINAGARLYLDVIGKVVRNVHGGKKDDQTRMHYVIRKGFEQIVEDAMRKAT
jgi:hypothetical protein